MLCVVIRGPSFQSVEEQLRRACQRADIIELRLDLFDSLDFSQLSSLIQKISLPTIFTLRTSSQGGRYSGTLAQRLNILKKLASLNPNYLDLEYDTPEAFIQNVQQLNPILKIILSYHDFERTSESLRQLKEMQKKPAALYKVATLVESTSDALRLLECLKQNESPTIYIGMGDEGKITRILAPLFKQPFTFSSLDHQLETAPGQLSCEEILETYNYKNLKDSTKIYGLIGHPVSQSLSHQTHNLAIHQQNLDAVYVKMPVKPEELPLFFSYIRKLPFKGLSVTMPLKEKVIPFLDEIDSKANNIGAVNTILIHEGRLIGYNTDGIGALNALEEHLSVVNKQILVIGAGGAAKAIAYSAKERGASICILNRDKSKAIALAAELECGGGGLEEMAIHTKKGYDILINCTPLSMPIDPKNILPHTHVMDINTKPKHSLFLQEALKRNCVLTYGYQMFAYQAAAQFDLWFKNLIDVSMIKKVIENKAKGML